MFFLTQSSYFRVPNINSNIIKLKNINLVATSRSGLPRSQRVENLEKVSKSATTLQAGEVERCTWPRLWFAHSEVQSTECRVQYTHHRVESTEYIVESRE